MIPTLEKLKSHIGTSRVETDHLNASSIAKLAATLDLDNPAPKDGDPIPPGWHTVLFGPTVATGALRMDGQVSGGGLSPPVPLPRRRLLGDSMTFLRPLRVGATVTRTASLADLRIEDTPEGPAMHELLRHAIADEDGDAVIEERRFVYLSAGAEIGGAAGTPLPEPVWRRRVEPTPVLMFRFAALRFNAHRVHYDRDYATGVEGCPGLLVAGGMVSLMLLDMCRQEAPDRPVREFAYRMLRPIFDTGPFTLNGAPGGNGEIALWAEGPEGRLAMTATARL